jgi:hypothetical protein
MKTLLSIAGAALLFSAFGCATTSNYDSKVHSWKGKDASMLVRNWGEPDAKEKLSSGNQMYVYARLHHPAVASTGPSRTVASVGEKPAPLPPAYIKCATYFEVDPHSTIVSVQYRGDECKSKD